MVKDYVLSVNTFFNDMVDFLPPGLFLSFASANVANGKYFDVYVKEFIGSMLMIIFTFSAGKWIGTDSWEVAWVVHAIGVILADYFGGGQQVNPAVTMSIWALGKCDYTEAFVRVAGQMGGGLISFPLFHALSEALKITPFGGPEFHMESNAEAAISEFVASFLLMWAIYIVRFCKKEKIRIDLHDNRCLRKKSHILILIVAPSFQFFVVTIDTAQLGIAFWKIPLYHQTNLDRCCHSRLD
jgi:glycerol uptake facilitator-like aquaporin